MATLDKLASRHQKPVALCIVDTAPKIPLDIKMTNLLDFAKACVFQNAAFEGNGTVRLDIHRLQISVQDNDETAQLNIKWTFLLNYGHKIPYRF